MSLRSLVWFVVFVFFFSGLYQGMFEVNLSVEDAFCFCIWRSVFSVFIILWGAGYLMWCELIGFPLW